MLFECLTMGAFTVVVLLIGGAGGIACYMLGAKRQLGKAAVPKNPSSAEPHHEELWLDNAEDQREKHFDDVLQNIEVYDGTENGQRTVTPL